MRTNAEPKNYFSGALLTLLCWRFFAAYNLRGQLTGASAVYLLYSAVFCSPCVHASVHNSSPLKPVNHTQTPYNAGQNGAVATTPKSLQAYQNLSFQRLLYNVNDSDNSLQTVHATRQDQYGFIWLGGEHGLARFDGHTLKTYLHNPNQKNGLPSNAIWDIEIDHDGVLWLATNAGLSRYHRATDSFINSKYDGPHQGTLIAHALRSLSVAHDNALLIGGDQGFAVLHPSRQKLTQYSPTQPAPFTLPSTAIHATFSDPDGTYWLGSMNAGLFKITHANDPPQLTQFAHNSHNANSLVHNHITSIMRDHQGFYG